MCKKWQTAQYFLQMDAMLEFIINNLDQLPEPKNTGAIWKKYCIEPNTVLLIHYPYSYKIFSRSYIK